jgi:DNA-binding Xre family transcriptional regulator
MGGTIGDLERGEAKVLRLELLDALARALGVNPAKLVARVEDESANG